MGAQQEHVISLSLTQYAEFLAILKRRVALRKNRAVLFFMDDVELEDRGEILRFRISSMPQHENTIDVHRLLYGENMILKWNEPRLANWNYYLGIVVALFIMSIVFGMGDPGRTGAPLFFLLLLPLWLWFALAVRKGQVSRGAALLRKTLDDTAELARKNVSNQSSPIVAA